MTRTPRAAGISVALAVLACAATALGATYQNDGFEDGDLAGFQAGFVSGEIGAACFHPPEDDFPLRINSVQLLFGGANDGASIFANLKVWREGGNGDPPSNLILDLPDIEFISSTTAMNEVDLLGHSITVTGPWCVGIEMTRDGLPSIARDDDGTIDGFNNWIFADGFGWVQSNVFGLTGDWIIRTIATGGVVPGDTGTPDTGTPDTGTPDTGTPDVGPDAGTAVRIDDVEQSGEDPSVDIEITITGAGFEPEYRYRVGARTLSGVQVFGTTEVVGTLDAGALVAGTYDVSVRGDFGEAVFSNAVFLRDTDVDLEAPVVTSVVPDETTLGDSAPIVVIGNHFVDGVVVLIDGRPLPGAASVSNPETLQSFVPGDHVDYPGEYLLTVRNPDGQTSIPVPFTFVAPRGGSSEGCGCATTSAPGAGWAALVLVGLIALRRRR